MNRKIKLYKISSYFGAFLYIILGLLIIGSIANGTGGLYINLIIGAFFIIIGYYLYAKAKSVIRLMINIDGLSKENQATSKLTIRFLFFECIFIIMCMLLVIILLSGVIPRVIGENLPVFD